MNKLNFKYFLKIIKTKDDTVLSEILTLVEKKYPQLDISAKYIILKMLYEGSLNKKLFIEYQNLKKIINFIEIKYEDNNKNKKIVSLFLTINKVNDYMLSELYKFIFFQEIILCRFLIYVVNSNNLDLNKFISDSNIEETLKSKINELHIEKSGLFVTNSKIINGLYLSENIKIFKLFYQKNFFETENLIDIFISKNKYNQLFKIKYGKKYSSKERQNNIFNEILNNFSKIKKYRNSISHNDLLFINKKEISDIHQFLKQIEDFYRDGAAAKIIKEHKNIIMKFCKSNPKNKSLMKNYNSYLN